MAHLSQRQYQALVSLVGVAEASGWSGKRELADAKAALATIPYLAASGTAVADEPIRERSTDEKITHLANDLGILGARVRRLENLATDVRNAYLRNRHLDSN